jgi:hypothetical protein
MNFKLTAALLGLVIFAIVGLMLLNREEGKGPKDKVSPNALIKLKPEDVQTLALERDGAKVLELKRNGADWQMIFPVTANVTSWQIDGIARDLGELVYKDSFTPKESGPRSLAEMGLKSPLAVVRIGDNTGAQHQLNIGKRSALGNRFATLDGKTDLAYEIDPSVFERLDKDPGDLRSKDLSSAQPTDIVELDIQKADVNMSFRKDASGWKLTAPVAARANDALISGIVSDMLTGQVVNFSSLAKNHPAVGLANPAVTLIARKAGAATKTTTVPAAPVEVAKLQLGNYSDLPHKYVYATGSANSDVVTINGDLLKKLDVPMSDFRATQVLAKDISNATGIEIARGADKLVLAKTGEDWKFTAPYTYGADTFAVGDFTTAAKNLRVNKYVDGVGDLKAMGLDPALSKISFTLPGETQQEVLLIGQPQKEELVTPVMRQGEATVYLVLSADLVRLRPTGHDLRQHQTDKIPAKAISAITLQQTAEKQTIKLKRDGTAWQVVTGSKSAPADEAKMTTLLARLDPFPITRWISTPVDAKAKPAYIVELAVDTSITQPAPATALAVQTAGPVAAKIETWKLAVYTQQGDFKDQAWGVLTRGEQTEWTFQITGDLYDALRVPSYAAPTTQPATQSATAPN